MLVLVGWALTSVGANPTDPPQELLIRSHMGLMSCLMSYGRFQPCHVSFYSLMIFLLAQIFYSGARAEEGMEVLPTGEPRRTVSRTIHMVPSERRYSALIRVISTLFLSIFLLLTTVFEPSPYLVPFRSNLDEHQKRLT